MIHVLIDLNNSCSHDQAITWRLSPRGSVVEAEVVMWSLHKNIR